MIVKRCGCGLHYTEAGWSALPLRGIDRTMALPGHVLEYRNCACASTLVRELPELEPERAAS